MMHGSDWPIPSAPRPEAGRFETLVDALPAIVVSLGVHAALAWWLLQPPVAGPSLRTPTAPRPSAPLMDVFFFTPAPPAAETPAAAPVARVDAVPFPMSKPTVVEAQQEVRETTAPTSVPAAPIDSAKFFDDIAGVARDTSGFDPSRAARSDARIRNQDRRFSDAPLRFKAPPLTPEQLVNRIGGMLLSTTAANSTTGLMGTVPGRDPGREIQAAHHDGLYLPRGCDDPEDPNISDECMGIPKR